MTGVGWPKAMPSDTLATPRPLCCPSAQRQFFPQRPDNGAGRTAQAHEVVDARGSPPSHFFKDSFSEHLLVTLAYLPCFGITW